MAIHETRERMQRLLSTYLFVTHKLTPELLSQVAGAGFQGVEIFCARSHFEYTGKQEIRAMASALEAHHLQLVSLHAPNRRDLSAMRESGAPLSRMALRSRRLGAWRDRKSTRLNSSHTVISYAVFCLKKKT